MFTQQKSPQSSNIVKVLLFGSVLISLAFWTNFSDPFNPLKFILMLAVASWSIGYLFVYRNQIFNNYKSKSILVLIVAFLLSLFIATLDSDLKRIAFIGEHQRNNGFLFYFSLCIILLTTATHFKISDYKLLSTITLILGPSIAVYGLFQINGKDFAQWNNPYNAIILTVGNPNFAGALLAMLGVLAFGFGIANLKIRFRFLLSLVSILLIVSTIILSEARQGLIAITLGIVIIIGFWLYYNAKKISYVYLLASAIVGILVVCGMLQVGPLSQLLYKGSVTVRGYYWQAGINMFKENPWFGVGVDSYGNFFRQYRDVGYPLNYGFDITSTNAHNVFIQFFSTAGLFTGLAYLAIILFIFWHGLISIKKAQTNQRIYITSVFSAWIALQSVSVISIDATGIAVWSWLLGGIVLSNYTSNNTTTMPTQIKQRNLDNPKYKSKQILLSTILLIPVLYLTINLFKIENSIQSVRLAYNPKIEENGKFIRSQVLEIYQNPFINGTQLVELSSFVATSGYSDDGLRILNMVIAEEPRNQDALDLLASYYHELKKPSDAVNLRLKIIELDPYNAKNYYKLGILYKSLGDYVNMERMQKIILSFAGDTPEGAAAVKDLVP